MSLLEVKDLTKNFGGLAAISRVNLKLEENELVGLIGPNGAGKTTLFNLLTGVYIPSSGSVAFKKNDHSLSLIGKQTSQIAGLGIARTFQNIRLFKDLSVLENVLIGLHNSRGANTFSSLFRTKHFFDSEEKMRQEARELLSLFDLESKEDYLAKNLPYGDQRRLEIVRALATKPKILFLDEPAAGMNPQESAELTQLILRIQNEFKLTVVLIEHDMSVVMNVCERIYVLEHGRVLAQGTPQEIRQNKEVIRAYLGGE